MSTNSIPITINGIRFRSLIEARWAEMFSRLGWEWEYEPIELNGYIPDFIIKFPYKHLLVEVKGETNMENIEQYAEKIINSGWDGEFLLVCSTLGYENGIYIGLLGSTHYSHSFPSGITWDMDIGFEYIKPKIQNRAFAHLSICDYCKKYTLYSDDGDWFCRNCGIGYSNKSLPQNRITKNDKIIINILQQCYNCEKTIEDHEKFTKWCDENGIEKYKRCPCSKFYRRCSSCSPYPYRPIPSEIPSSMKCSCIYENIYDNKEYEKIYTFWNEAKNSSQWKPK